MGVKEGAHSGKVLCLTCHSDPIHVQAGVHSLRWKMGGDNPQTKALLATCKGANGQLDTEHKVNSAKTSINIV